VFLSSLAWRGPAIDLRSGSFERSAGGFTLIELLVTLAIMAVLALITVPAAEVVIKRQKEQELRRSLQVIRDAIDAHKKAFDDGYLNIPPEKNGYPLTLEALVNGVPPSGGSIKVLKFLRRLPRDPMNPNAALSDAETWGKRSYASEADNPLEGDDVYDVYSLSDKNGLNGIPYRRW
jgi:general secretion pathway protein G